MSRIFAILENKIEINGFLFLQVDSYGDCRLDPYGDTFLPVLSLLFLDVGEVSSIFTREWIASARAFI